MKTATVRHHGISSLTALQLLVLAAGCDANPQPPATDLAEQPDELRTFGDTAFGGTCTPELIEMHREIQRYGRVAVSSPAFAECIEQSFTEGTEVGGPYLSCPADPLAAAQISVQVEAAINTARSPNRVAVECAGGGGLASTWQNSGLGHTLAESFSWSGWLAGQAAQAALPHCDSVDPPAACRGVWPFDQAAGVVWHEAAHTQGYSHGANDQENAVVACGRTNSPGWHFQVNTAPYIIGACVGSVLSQSDLACGDVDTCPGGGLRIVDEYGGDTCSCLDDPAEGHTWTTGFGSSVGSGGWGANHPRTIASIDAADQEPDVVGFGHNGVVVAHGLGGEFGPANLAVADFGVAQGWSVAQHPRMLADVDGDGRDDIVGFGGIGVRVARARGADFEAPSWWLADFGSNGGWSVTEHLRVMADVDADGDDDVVAFGAGEVFVARSNGSGFVGPSSWSTHFANDEGWTVNNHPRIVRDINDDGMADIVGFGGGNQWISLSTGASFAPPVQGRTDFTLATGWTSQHPRTLAFVDDDVFPDIVGFGPDGVYVGFGDGATFGPAIRLSTAFGSSSGWRTDRHLRMLDDMDGDGLEDIVGFGNDGAFVARSTGSSFSAPEYVVAEMGWSGLGGAWRLGTHPRMTFDMNGDGLAELVGFAANGIRVFGLGWTAQSPD